MNRKEIDIDYTNNVRKNTALLKLLQHEKLAAQIPAAIPHRFLWRRT